MRVLARSVRVGTNRSRLKRGLAIPAAGVITLALTLSALVVPGAQAEVSAEQQEPRTSSLSISVSGLPKQVKIGNRSSSNCMNRIRIKLNGTANPEATYYVRYVVNIKGAATSDAGRQINNVKIGKKYKIFPYEVSQSGLTYQVSLCGVMNSALLPLPKPSTQQAVFEVGLFETVNGQTRTTSGYVKKTIRVKWRGFSG